MTAHLLLLAAVIIWGWTFVATKILLAELGPVEIFALRLAIGLPVLGIILLIRRAKLAFTREDLQPILVGGTIFAIHFLIQITALVTTTATNTGWIITVTPLVLAVLSFFLFRERLGWLGIAGIGVATLGVLVLVSRGELTNIDALKNLGDWLVLLSTLTWALYTISTRSLARRRNPLAVTFAVLLIAAVLMTPIVLVIGDLGRVRSLSPQGVLALLYLGIPATALAQWFWQVGIARVGATRSALYLYIEPLATVALAVPLLGEQFGVFTAIGAALILGGVYLGQRRTV